MAHRNFAVFFLDHARNVASPHSKRPVLVPKCALADDVCNSSKGKGVSGQGMNLNKKSTNWPKFIMRLKNDLLL